MSVIVEIERFSGPLDLLLYLIRKEEMDIFDINIHQITKQYLLSVKQMKKLDLEKAGDFIAMAATLIQIKAKMLVPAYNEEGEEIEQEDPRKGLGQRLLEYQKFQDVGKDLYNRHLVGRDVFLRGSREKVSVVDGEIIIEEDNALYALIAAYRSSVRRIKKTVHSVAQSLKSVRDRIREIRTRLIPGKNVPFSSLMTASNDQRGELLITFLSVLELAKMGLVHLFQNENFSDIHVEATKDISEDALSQVEDYEYVGAPEEAQQDIWINDEERAEVVVEAVAATDEEIMAEEETYGREFEAN